MYTGVAAVANRGGDHWLGQERRPERCVIPLRNTPTFWGTNYLVIVWAMF